jgi:hypothetical protein
MDAVTIFTLVVCLTVFGAFGAMFIEARRVYKEDNK